MGSFLIYFISVYFSDDTAAPPQYRFAFRFFGGFHYLIVRLIVGYYCSVFEEGNCK